MAGWPSTPGDEVVRLFRSFWVSRAIYVAVELGIADLLSDGPRTVADLAAATNSHAQSLYRVLRLLASEGVFAEADNGRFELTPKAAALRKDAGPARLQVLFLGRPASWEAAGNLSHTVRTGETAFEKVHGVDFFGYNRRHPDDQLLFDQLMAAQTRPVARAVAGIYDFSSMASLIDVGGGRGAFAIEVLTAQPHLKGVVFDQPAVAEEAKEAIGAAGLSGRCEAVGGDFFQSVPHGHDAYLLKYVLHDWDDEQCVAILSSCRRAIRADGRLLVVEAVIPPGNGPSFGKTQDINMLINLDGRERTEAEYGELYKAAGFELTRCIPVIGELHVIEGMPA
jgi:ubiquinone/menaquinone biosynthesis C-methylase UbiE